LTERIEWATHQLDSFIGELGQQVFKVAMDDWLQFPLPPRHRVGWLPPIPYGEPKYMITYCPELIAEWGRDLEDDGFTSLLSVVETIWARHIQYLEEGLPAAQRNEMIEEELFDKLPEAMTALGLLQMDALTRLT
jgi:hypothetical protein